MTHSGDDLALLHNLAADGADFVAGVAVLGAGGSLGTHQLDLVTQSGDDLALGDDLAAGLADHVAGVAILGAGGGLGVHGLGLGVQVSSQSLGVVHGLIVALGLGNGDVDLVQSGGIIDGEGQGGHGGTGGHAVEVHIAQGDLAGSILVGAVLGVEGHVGQGQVGGIVIHGEQAVGGSILGQDVDGDGLLIGGHGDVGGGGVLSSIAHGQAHQNLAAAGQQGAVLGPDDAGAVLDDIALKGGAADKRGQTEGQGLGLVGGREGQGLEVGAALEGPLADESDVVGNDEVHQRGAALEHLLADGGQLGGHEGGQVQAVVERGVKAGGIAQHGDLGEAAAGKGVGADEGQALGDHHLLQGGAAGEAAGANGGDVGQVGQVLQALAGEERRLGQLGQVLGQSHGGYSRAVGELVAVCVHRGDGVGNGDAGQGVGIIENTGAEAGDALGDHQVALQGLAEVEGLDAHGGQVLGQDAVVGVAQRL